MMIQLVTNRIIDDRDLDIWLKMYRDECGYRIDVDKIKTDKTAVWMDDSPETRSKAITRLTIIK